MKKYSSDKRVCFESETHSYFLGEKKLESVTTLLSRFKNKFDSDFYSKKIAKRDNKTQQEVLNEWKEKANKSCDIGTAIHKIFEDYFYNKYSFINSEFSIELSEVKPEYYIEFFNKSLIAVKFIKDFFITKRLIPVASEYIVYNDFIAGQIDMVCKDSKDNFYIIDFKTNSKIDKNSYGKSMKDFFKIYQDSTYYHYCIQLSIYKELLKKYKINRIFLIHITEENYEFIECENVFNYLNFNDLFK
jgi:ATP-dependent exoDNAse (exonuclease V) beta subunit